MLSKSSSIPDVSIITVCKNADKDFFLTFQSVLSQTNVNLEFIVQDGESSDATLSFLNDQTDSRIKLVSCPDRGIYDAMNLAVRRAAGKWCLFLNAGDLFLTETSLSEMLSEIEEHKPIDLFISSCFNAIDSCVTVYPKRLSRYFLFQSTVCHQVQLWKMSTLSTFLPFDARLKIYADHHLLLRAFLSKIVVYSSQAAYISYKDMGFSSKPELKSLKQQERQVVLRECFGPQEYLLYSFLTFLSMQKLRVFVLEPLRGTRIFKVYRHLTNLLRKHL